MNATGHSVELEIDYLFEAGDWVNEPGVKKTLAYVLDQGLAYLQAKESIAFVPQCEISMVFTNDAAIRSLNAHYRKMDKPTNVLSFPIDEEADIFGPMLGDIVFARETIVREAEEMGLEFDNHLSHLCIHGFLHLLGYDHVDANQAEIMEKLEIAILAELGIENPYRGDLV